MAEPQVRAGEEYRVEKEEIDGWLTEAGRAKTGIYSRYLTIDGGHPSKIGHQVIAEQLYNTARSYIMNELTSAAPERRN